MSIDRHTHSEDFPYGYNSDQEPERPNYALRRTVVAGMVGTFVAGTIFAGNWIHDNLGVRDLGCVEVEIGEGFAGEAVSEAVQQLDEQYEAFDARTSRETNAAAESLGIVHPGETIEVCAQNDRLLGSLIGDPIEVSRADN